MVFNITLKLLLLISCAAAVVFQGPKDVAVELNGEAIFECNITSGTTVPWSSLVAFDGNPERGFEPVSGGDAAMSRSQIGTETTVENLRIIGNWLTAGVYKCGDEQGFQNTAFLEVVEMQDMTVRDGILKCVVRHQGYMGVFIKMTDGVTGEYLARKVSDEHDLFEKEGIDDMYFTSSVQYALSGVDRNQFVCTAWVYTKPNWTGFTQTYSVQQQQ